MDVAAIKTEVTRVCVDMEDHSQDFLIGEMYGAELSKEKHYQAEWYTLATQVLGTPRQGNLLLSHGCRAKLSGAAIKKGERV